MRVATFNINGLKARLPFLLRWLEEDKPDLAGLQELKMADDQVPREVFEKAGYHVVTHGQKGWNGVAVLSREPVTVTCTGLPGQEDMGARLLTVKSGDLSFITVYCPNGKSVDHEDFARKLSWLDALAGHLASQHDPSQPAVLCGDLNLVPADLDSWAGEHFRGQIFHTEAERSRFACLLAWGFRDLYRDRHPDQPGFTWWDYRAGAFHKQQGLRIDFVLATSSVAERVSEVRVDRRWRKKIDGMISSDHIPVSVDLA